MAFKMIKNPKNRTVVIIIAVFLLLAVIIAIFNINKNTSGTDALSKISSIPRGVDFTPGGQSTEKYSKLLQEENLKRIQQAQAEGKSFVATIGGQTKDNTSELSAQARSDLRKVLLADNPDLEGLLKQYPNLEDSLIRYPELAKLIKKYPEMAGLFAKGCSNTQTPYEMLSELFSKECPNYMSAAPQSLQELMHQYPNLAKILQDHPELSKIVQRYPALAALLANNPKLVDFLAKHPELAEMLGKNPKLASMIANNPALGELLAANPQLARLLADNPDLVDSLEKNPELAKLLTDNPELAKMVANDPQLARTLLSNPDLARQLLNDPELLARVTKNPALINQLAKNKLSDKLSSDPEIAKLIKDNPALADLLAKHPELADLIKAHPNLVNLLLSNPDLAELVAKNPSILASVMKNPDFLAKLAKDPNLIKKLLSEPRLATALGTTPELLELLQKYPELQDILAKYPNIAAMLAKNPRMASMVAENPSLAAMLAQDLNYAKYLSGEIPVPGTLQTALLAENKQASLSRKQLSEEEAANMAMMNEAKLKAIQQVVSAMDKQASAAMQSWSHVASQGYAAGEFAPANKVHADKSKSGKDDKDHAGSSSGKESKQEATIAIKAGTIIFAVLETSVNSDEPGPIMARVVEGPLKGSRVIGGFHAPSNNQEKLTLNFSKLNIPGAPYTIQFEAVAIDPDTARTALASDVDHHYLMRYGTLFAATFLQGYSKAVAESGTTSTAINTAAGSSTTTSTGKLSGKQQFYEGLGKVGEGWAKATAPLFNTKPTITINEGMGIGLLVTSDIEAGLPAIKGNQFNVTETKLDVVKTDNIGETNTLSSVQSTSQIPGSTK